MTDAATGAPASLAGVPARRPGRSLAWWGMVMFVLTEALLFANLIFAYLYVRARSTSEWPPDGVRPPELALPAVLTVVLVASSVPAQLAGREAHAGRWRRVPVLLLATGASGLVFLGLQAVEYARTSEHLTPRTNAYGSLQYTITGFHGAHVALGVGLLLWAAARCWRRPPRPAVVESVVLYWHFVDAVWLVILAVLYLSVAW